MGGTGHEGQGGAGGTGPDPLARLAQEIDQIYSDDVQAPVEWHLKEHVRKELRQAVRYRAHQNGFGGTQLREVADRVEQYALRHYVKLPVA